MAPTGNIVDHSKTETSKEGDALVGDETPSSVQTRTTKNPTGALLAQHTHNAKEGKLTKPS